MFMNMDDGLIKAVQLWPRLGIVVVGIKQGRRISGNNIGKKYDRDMRAIFERGFAKRRRPCIQGTM